MLAALIFIGKPILKVSEHIERYTLLHCAYGETFSAIEVLISDVRRNDGFTEHHRERAEELINRCDGLALREDASINWKKVTQIKQDVDKAIPAGTLWLPSK